MDAAEKVKPALPLAGRAVSFGEGKLLGFLGNISGGGSGNAALPLDQVHNIERDDRNKAAEDDRHHEPQRAAVGQKLPDGEGDGAYMDAISALQRHGAFHAMLARCL